MTGWDAVAEFQAWCDSEGIEIGDDALETWRYENGVTLSALALRRIDKLIERTTREEIMSSKLPVGAAVRVLGTTLTGVVTRSKAIHDVRLDDYSPAGDMTDTERSQSYHRSELVRVGRLDGIGSDMEVPVGYSEYDGIKTPHYRSEGEDYEGFNRPEYPNA
jgi:hypothetical protein